jgi:DNA-binding transcriptional MerR regulator/methylmalonyl-CoA mutase cobalamin-binding subunit
MHVTQPSEGMSIGALSRATGVPADTLRTWERRYGFPAPERTGSGHRRYSLRTLARLRLVVQALELGHRPSTVLATDEATLAQMVAATNPVQEPATRVEDSGDVARLVQRLLEHVERFDGRAFERDLGAAGAGLGGLSLLEQVVAPFLRELGERWASGELGVRHEHFASERLREFLSRQWRPLSDAATGPTLVCATPPGELHVLGLHMAALALALHNARLVFLGADAPTPEIARAVGHHAAAAVILSAAEGVDRTRLTREIGALRAGLPESVPIVAGGQGFQPPVAGTVAVASLSELVRWFERRAS